MTLMPKEKYYKCRCLGHQSGAALREGAGSSLARGHPHLHDKLARLEAANEILKLVRGWGWSPWGSPWPARELAVPPLLQRPLEAGPRGGETSGRPLLPAPQEGEVGQGRGGPVCPALGSVSGWQRQAVTPRKGLRSALSLTPLPASL